MATFRTYQGYYLYYVTRRYGRDTYTWVTISNGSEEPVQVCDPNVGRMTKAYLDLVIRCYERRNAMLASPDTCIACGTAHTADEYYCPECGQSLAA